MPPEKVLETRTVTAQFEMRDTNGTPVLEGYASTFNSPYDLGPFREQVSPSAFKRTLGTNPDVKLLVDHEGQPLARTTSGTMQLSTDTTGLHVRAELEPSDPDVQRLLPKMRRGDLDQMSFAFRVPAGGDSWDEGFGLRTLNNVELSGGDVSVVTYPANPGTSVSIRAADLLEARCVFIDVMVRELRAGKAISADNAAKLKKVLEELAKADAATDLADVALDNAQAQLADVLGVPNPDPPEPKDDAPQANSGRPLNLAKAIAASLGIAA